MAELVIQLDDEKLHKLEALAEEKNLILAEMLAEVLDDLLAQETKQQIRAWDTWEGAGMFHSGRTDTGANADEILAREWRPATD